MDAANNPTLWLLLLCVIFLQYLTQENTIDYYMCYFGIGFLMFADIVINIPNLRQRNLPDPLDEIVILI